SCHGQSKEEDQKKSCEEARIGARGESRVALRGSIWRWPQSAGRDAARPVELPRADLAGLRTPLLEKAWAYGTSGYGQLGIDILVRMKAGGFQAWQSKRYRMTW